MSTHKKGKFQELMGQVGMSAEDIDQGRTSLLIFVIYA